MIIICTERSWEKKKERIAALYTAANEYIDISLAPLAVTLKILAGLRQKFQGTFLFLRSTLQFLQATFKKLQSTFLFLQATFLFLQASCKKQKISLKKLQACLQWLQASLQPQLVILTDQLTDAQFYLSNCLHL